MFSWVEECKCWQCVCVCSCVHMYMCTCISDEWDPIIVSVQILPSGGAIWAVLFVHPLWWVKSITNSCRPQMKDEFLLFNWRNLLPMKTTFYSLHLEISKKYSAKTNKKKLQVSSSGGCLLQPSIKWKVVERTKPKWMNSSTLCCGCECVSMHICTSVCVCASGTKQIPLEPVIVQKSHAVPMLTDTKQWVPPHSLALALSLISLSLSFSPCYVLFPSPFHSLAPITTVAIIISLCFQLIFSLTSSLGE